MTESPAAYIYPARSSDDELARDSLESSDDGSDYFNVYDETENHVKKTNTCTEDTSNLPAPGKLPKVSAESKQQVKTSAKKQVDQRKEKNLIELNKITVSKGRPKPSYGEIHLKKHGKVYEKKQNDILKSSPPSRATFELCEQVAVEEKRSLFNTFPANAEEELSWCNCNDSEQGMKSSENNHTLQLRSSTQDFGDFPCNSNHKSMEETLYRLEENKASNTNFFLPSVQMFPISVQSAPADMQAHAFQPLQQTSFRSTSLSFIKHTDQSYTHYNNSRNSKFESPTSEHEDRIPTTYSALYVSSKQNTKPSYKPYTLGDFKRLKKDTKPGGLGPNTKSEEHQEKVKKALRQKEYSIGVKQKNWLQNPGWKKKQTAGVDVSAQKEKAVAKREKALTYAKTIPKPVTTKAQTASTQKPVEKQQTLLDILQQRHKNEKKAIDAMRKDLQAKLRTT